MTRAPHLFFTLPLTDPIPPPPPSRSLQDPWWFSLKKRHYEAPAHKPGMLIVFADGFLFPQNVRRTATILDAWGAAEAPTHVLNLRDAEHQNHSDFAIAFKVGPWDLENLGRCALNGDSMMMTDD